MTHQAITAGAHLDGIYHDSHALEGGEGRTGHIINWAIDTFNRLIIIRREYLIFEMYNLDTGDYIADIPIVLPPGVFLPTNSQFYANFADRTLWLEIQGTYPTVAGTVAYSFRDNIPIGTSTPGSGSTPLVV